MNLHRFALQKSEHIYIALICTNVHWSASMYTDLHRYAVIHTDRHGGDGCIDGCNVWDILSTFLMRFQILLSPKSTLSMSNMYELQLLLVKGKWPCLLSKPRPSYSSRSRRRPIHQRISSSRRCRQMRPWTSRHQRYLERFFELSRG